MGFRLLYSALAISFFYLCLTTNVIASSVNLPLPTPSILNGTADYQTILKWSKLRISHYDTQSKLNYKTIPVELNAQCGNLKLLFIQIAPSCGNINCKYLVFSESLHKYRFLSEMGFNAMRLFCYPKDKNFTHYLFTSWHDTNSISTFRLDQVTAKFIENRANIEVDMSKSQNRETNR